MERDNQNTEQPTGLFAYIAGQQESAVPADEEVNLNPTDAPGSTVPTESSGNAAEAPADQGNPGVTTQGTELDQTAYLRLQQENQRLEQERDRQINALLLLGQQSGQREQQLFERSIEHLDETDQALEREKRRVEQLESKANWLENTVNAQTQQANAIQERADKVEFAKTVHQRLGLPNDPTVINMLMESSSPQELAWKANNLATFLRNAQGLTQQQVATAARANGVHAAGGETAPAKPENSVPLHSNDLIGMMRQREYTLGT